LEQSNQSSGPGQLCAISQENSDGSNQAVVQQTDTARSGSAQIASQDAEISQVVDTGSSGNNSVSITQYVNQQTGTPTGTGAESQDAQQVAAVSQVSDTGNNQASVNESQVQNEQIPTANGTKGPAQPVLQTQNTACTPSPTWCPNENAAVYQTSSLTDGGTNNLAIAESLAQKQGAPGNNVSGSQTQGSPLGGLNGHVDQHSSGVSTASGTQNELQQQSPTTGNTPLNQTQYDPAWFGSPQETNPNNQYLINQAINQQASNNANQNSEIFTNCDTTGTCTGNESATQNGVTDTNSCTGSICHIGLDCSTGDACTLVNNNCENAPCELPPPPPPPPDFCTFNICEIG
jgi:hypothetical protein